MLRLRDCGFTVEANFSSEVLVPLFEDLQLALAYLVVTHVKSNRVRLAAAREWLPDVVI